MTQRTAFIVAAALTAFVLVVVGGVAAQVSQVGQAATATPAEAVAELPTSAAVSQSMQDNQPAAPTPTPADAKLLEREQEYQQRLAEANQRIADANAQLQEAYTQQQALAEQLNQVQAQSQAAQPVAIAQAPVVAQQADPPPAPAYAFSPDMAAAVALNAAPGATVTANELVLFEGTPAYEVLTDRGAVYVDANSGQVLYNAATPPPSVSTNNAQQQGDDDRGEQEHEQEHEGDDD